MYIASTSSMTSQMEHQELMETIVSNPFRFNARVLKHVDDRCLFVRCHPCHGLQKTSMMHLVQIIICIHKHIVHTNTYATHSIHQSMNNMQSNKYIFHSSWMTTLACKVFAWTKWTKQQIPTKTSSTESRIFHFNMDAKILVSAPESSCWKASSFWRTAFFT